MCGQEPVISAAGLASLTSVSAMRVFAVLVVAVLSGCSGILVQAPEPQTTYAQLGFAGDPTGLDADKWPDLDGITLRILDNGAFSWTCPEAARQFGVLTGAIVLCEDGGDTGSAIAQLKQDHGSGQYDILYGADNTLLAKAEPYLLPYTPQHGSRLPEGVLFFGARTAWPATPVDQGYVAINWDPNFPGLNATIHDLHKVRDKANFFVTQCPNQSSPGLAFLLITIGRFGEWDGAESGGPVYDWHDYWKDLFAKEVRVVPDWSTAYESHFSAGYGDPTLHPKDEAIVVSYTESPAYEAFSGRPRDQLAQVLLERDSTFHQIQTMGIVKGTRNASAAQAWIEYTLTDHFQSLAAPFSAVYPVIPTVDVRDVYGGIDPAPGLFKPVTMGYDRVSANLDRWMEHWTSLAPASVQATCGSVSI